MAHDTAATESIADRYESLVRQAILTATAFRSPEAALAMLDEAVALDPARAEAHHNRGVLLDQLGRAEESVAALDAALARDPAHREAAINRAFILGRDGGAEAGVPAWRAVVERWPDDHAAAFNLAVLLEQAGERDATLEAVDRALAVQAFPEGEALRARLRGES